MSGPTPALPCRHPRSRAVLRDLRIDHLLDAGFGRVSLVMDGRRVLLTFVPEEAEAVAELIHRRDKGTHAAVVDDPGAL